MLRVLSRLRATAATVRVAPPIARRHPSVSIRTVAVDAAKDQSKVTSATQAALPVVEGVMSTPKPKVSGGESDQKHEQAPKAHYAKRIGYGIGVALTVYNMFSSKDKHKPGIQEQIALIHARSEISTSESLLPAMRNIFNRILDTEIRPTAIMVITRDGVNTDAQLASIKAEWDKLLMSHNVNLDLPILVCTQDKLYESSDKVRATKLAERFNYLSKPAILYCGSETEAQHLTPIYANAMKNSGAKFETYDAWPKSVLARVFK